jgi:hypothetical protein
MRRQHSKSDCDDAFRTTQRGENAVKQKGIVSYLSGEDDVGRDDLFVNITLYRISGDLVREFALKFAYRYPGGVSEAIQDLMRNAVKE